MDKYDWDIAGYCILFFIILWMAVYYEQFFK